MKVSVFDKVSGTFLWWGEDKGNKYAKLVGQGHMVVPGESGGAPDWMMYDFPTTSVVPDTARRVQSGTSEIKKEQDRVRIDAIHAELETLYGSVTQPDQQAQTALLSELARIGTDFSV